ncbi:MAG TPA: hypothetical protein VGR30_10735 [Candidatus Binatia bacterium]|jgi:hypothetical protein|nr:hypothetical protein [Candidatus Binatia bacterium]
MAVSVKREVNSLEHYINDLRSIWGDGKNPQLPFRVKALLERLLASTRPAEPWMAQLMAEGKPSRELYRDPEHGFIQMGHVHKQGHTNLPHDHGPCWVVYGSYSGLTEITTYRRNSGEDPGRASLEKKELHRLTPGVAYPYLPGEIHSTHAVEGPAVVFRFLSQDLEKVERYRYNLEKGMVSRV